MKAQTTAHFLVLALSLLSSKVLGQGCQSLEEIACSTTEHGDFSIFCKLMFTDFPLMGLDLKLDGGTWTVFMPTDSAFDTYEPVIKPYFTLESNMFWETSFDGLNIMSYHFHNGYTYRRSDLYCQELIKMSNGDHSRHKCLSGSRYQNGGGNHGDHGLPNPKITKFDIEFCNGVIHVVDGIMLPGDYDKNTVTLIDESAPADTGSISDTDSIPDEDLSDYDSDHDHVHYSEGGCEVPEQVYAVVNQYRIRTDDNCVEEWRKACNNNANGARIAEQGALRFDIIGVTETEYILYELYHDEIAFFEGHLFTEHFRDWFTVRQRCVVYEEAVFPKRYIDNTYDDSTFFSPFCTSSKLVSPDSVNHEGGID